MPGGKYDDLFNYSKEYYEKFYGGSPIGAYSDQYYKSQQEMLERRRLKMLARFKDTTSGLREGYMPSGLDMQIQSEQVDTPIAEAEAALDYQKLQAEQFERTRRETITMQAAKDQIAQEKADAQRRGQFWGKIANLGITTAGAIIGTIVAPGAGTVAGASIGAGIGKGVESMIGGGGSNAATPQAAFDPSTLYQLQYEKMLKDLETRLGAIDNSGVANNYGITPENSGYDAVWDPIAKDWIRY